ncbi:MAG: phospho-sugar mutase [Clostridiales bacterium]
MKSTELYNLWKSNEYFNKEVREELEGISGDAKEIEERFYKELEFGTGGLRGIIGAGTNRMNEYVVRKTTQGISNYIIKKGDEYKKKGVVISFDSRNKSPEFALEAALVFANNGIKAYLFDELRPVPILSYAVRYLKTSAGIMITASHNPKEYNGYKVYADDGGQIPLDISNAVLEEITNISDITKINLIDESIAIEKDLLEIIGEEIDNSYIKDLKTLSVNPKIIKSLSDSFKIIYTPLHGTGNKPVRRILSEVGFNNVLVVKEQELPDGNFPTVKSPNPEEKEAFKLAIDYAKKENVDLIIGTDPDCDRVGVVVRNADNEYVTLTGNQIGCLMLEYILSQKNKNNCLPENGFVVKTIVTTEMSRVIADNYKIELVEVLTGFKFIGEKIKDLDEFGDKKYLFGFEESYGYLAGTFARDKDGVVTSMLIAELAAFYKTKNMSLYEGLQKLFSEYGYFLETLTSYKLEGQEGNKKINDTIEILREKKANAFENLKINKLRDYKISRTYNFINDREELIDLPKSNVLYYELDNNFWFCIRPSGTEPKIKIYYGITGKTKELAQKNLDDLKTNVLKVIDNLLEI